MKKQFFARILSVLLTTGVITSGFTVPAIAVEDKNTTQSKNPGISSQAVGSTLSSSNSEQYDTSVVDKTFLYSHTSKTSEVPNNGSIEKYATTTNDDEIYSELGLGDNLSEESKKLLDSSLNTNPLAGYTFVNPEELLVGHINRSNQHEGWIKTKDNVDVTNISSISGDFDSLKGSTDDLYVSEGKDYQTHNAIGLDCDGDGIDELAYLSLYNGGMNVTFYDRKKEANGNISTKWTEMTPGSHIFDLKLSSDNEILDIIASESKGYTAMTAGDFDNDGVEELAVYAPAANNGKGVPRIVIIKLDCSGSTWSCKTIGEINLTDTYTTNGAKDNDFDNLKKGSGSFENWRMPVVALSTTSTRLGNADTSTASTKYETYDDLVINVSVPRVYTDDDDNMDSVVAIYSYDKNAKKFTKMFQDNLNYGTYRMTFTNSTDADLNGDGFDEIVVAGLKETGLQSGNHKSSGSLSSSTNLVQLITWNGTSYETVWTGKDGNDGPKNVEAVGNLDIGHFQSIEPIALSAGHYYTDDNTPATQDQLCVQGVIFSCTNAKVSGTALYSESDSSGKISYCVVDTKPYCDMKNYNTGNGDESKQVKFTKLFRYDISPIAKHNQYIDLAVSGHFMTEAEVDAIVIVSNDTNSGNDDEINYDISIIAYDPETKKWQTKVYNDYIYHKDEDDKGTSLYVCFIDSDLDTMYYKYTGKYVTYSSPTLYSVIQAPPYYSENNASSTSVSYSISHGVTTGNKVNWGAGAVEQINFPIKIAKVNVTATEQYIGSYTWKHTESTTQTFNLKTNSDYAVVFTLPIIVNNYDVWYPDANNGQGQWAQMQTTQSLDPVFAALTIDDYNVAVSKITDEDQKKCAPEIKNLPKATAGDPIAYYHDYEDVTQDKSDKKKFNDSKQDINTTFNSVSNKIDFTDATEHTEGFNMRIQVMVSFGNSNISGGGGAVFDLGYTHIDANSNGTSFSVTYGGIKGSNMDNVTFSDTGNAYPNYYLEKDGKKLLMTSNLLHYQSADYIYSAHAVPYVRSDIKKDGDDVYILSHYTDNYPSVSPPEPVQYFGIQSVSKTSDNKFEITFAWDSKTRNEDRKADGYNIYVKDAKSGNNQVNLVNTDGPIRKSTTSEITTYTTTGFTDLNSGDYKFYIAPVYINYPSELSVDVREGIICKSLEISDITQFIDDKNIVISTQPENQYLKENASKQKVTFSVDAYDTETGDDSTLSFQWQRYNTAAQNWVNVKSTDENGREFTETSKDHSSVYSFYATESDCYVPIRCLITVERSSINYMVRSTDSVAVLHEIKPESITVSPSKASVFDGEKFEFSVKFNPANATDKSIIWTSSDERIATVDENGVVTGIKGGQVEITAALASNPDMKVSAQLEVKHQQYDENGFCKGCGQYQPAVLNSDGVYEISNAGQLYWFAALVNNDSTHAEFTKDNREAKAILTADIDLENREWKPIMNFNGSFDGQNHTVSHLKIANATSYTGMFGSSAGTITNFTVSGDIILNSYTENIGGIVGYANGAKISNVASYINISNGDQETRHIGGIVGTITSAETFVEQCVYYGTIHINNSHDCIGGIVGYTNGGGRIKNCVNLGSVTTTKDGAYTGGILGYVNNSAPKIENCYNYGTVSNGSNTSYCGAIIGWARNCNANNIKNNYYLDTSSTLAFGSGGKSGLNATSRTAEQFADGEVTYLLNQGVTDGSQLWYQNIDNGQTPDAYPVLDNMHGMVYLLTYNNTYSNYDRQPTAFDSDENGNLIIRTYDDLVQLSELIRTDYETYGSLNYVLNNNIIASSDSEWTQGIGSIDENKPFNGTFDGNGYVISGLNINTSQYGGLFEYIGKNGRVEEIQLIDCDYVSDCAVAGAIAAVNDGVIDHCLSGINVTSGIVFIDINGDGEKEKVNISLFNSDIKGTVSGGVVAVNNGSIIGTRNASVVTGSQTGGGIAAENTGLIYGCANTGTIGSTRSVISGGLVGENNGTIQASYNSGKVNGKSSDFVGSVSGSNKAGASVTDTFYTTVNGLNPVGTGSEQQLDSTNTKKLIEDMHKESFVDELNGVSDEYTISWTRNDKRNNGYPTIVCNFYQSFTQKLTNGISLTGCTHQSLNINYKTYADTDVFESYKDNAKVLSAYELDWADGNGNQLPMELWLQGTMTVSVPLDDSNAELLLLDADGNISKCEYIYENGNAVFTVDEPVSFALVSEKSHTDNLSSSDNPDTSSTQTGDSSYMTFSICLFALVGSLAVFVAVQRRRKFSGKNE